MMFHLGIGAKHSQGQASASRNPDSWLIPDVSVTHPSQPGDDYYEGAPLLAIEVVSPCNTAEQIHGKIEIYLANGAREVWVVYPQDAFRVGLPRRRCHVVKGSLTSELLPGLSIDLAQVFAD